MSARSNIRASALSADTFNGITFRGVIRRLDTLLVDEREEMLMVHEQRAGQVADVGVDSIDVVFTKREELLLDGERLSDQFRAGEGRTTGVRVAVKAMPQAEELSLEGERLATKVFCGCGLREVLRAQQVAREMRPTELAPSRGERQVRRQAVAAQDSGKRRSEQVPQHI